MSQCGKTLSLKKISSNQLFSNFFSKTVTFTKFLPKMHESKFPEFPHCALQWICNRFHGKNREIETRTICVLELWMWLHEKKDEMKWAKLLDSFCVWFNVKIDIDFSFLNIWFHGKSYEIEKHVMPLNVISRKKNLYSNWNARLSFACIWFNVSFYKIEMGFLAVWFDFTEKFMTLKKARSV